MASNDFSTESYGIVYEQLLSNIRPEYVQSMKMILFNFITKVISYELARQQSILTCGNSEAVDKLKIFMNVSDDPIPCQHEDDNYMSRKSKSWSQYEDQRLIAGVHKYGPSDWTKISSFVGNGRNRCQCSQRWARSLNPLINKTLWNQYEDLKLINAVNKYGDKSWTKISNDIAGRTDVQCRYRYQIISKKFNNELLNQMIDAYREDVKPRPQKPVQTPKKQKQTTTHVEIPDSKDALKLLDLIMETSNDPQSLFHSI